MTVWGRIRCNWKVAFCIIATGSYSWSSLWHHQYLDSFLQEIRQPPTGLAHTSLALKHKLKPEPFKYAFKVLMFSALCYLLFWYVFLVAVGLLFFTVILFKRLNRLICVLFSPFLFVFLHFIAIRTILSAWDKRQNIKYLIQSYIQTCL